MARVALSLVSLGLLLAGAGPVAAQPAHDAHDDEHHGHLHFSHPLVVESPSPDTKLRLDQLWTRAGASAEHVSERGLRAEGEYAFTPGLSLAVTVPYVWRRTAEGSHVRGVGNTELTLKAASVRWGERGLLVGGGLSTGLPTGSDARGIGSSRAIGLEPFVDAGVKRGALEVVGFARYGTTIRNPVGVDAERELAFDGSILHQVTHAVEALFEVEAGRGLSADDHAAAISIAPGLKIYPFATRSLMLGVSAGFGLTGEARDTRGVLVSAFYHF